MVSFSLSMFALTWGDDPIWPIFFKWVENPPTSQPRTDMLTICIYVIYMPTKKTAIAWCCCEFSFFSRYRKRRVRNWRILKQHFLETRTSRHKWKPPPAAVGEAVGWWNSSGQIIATSHDLTPNGGLVREIPLFQGNLGWWNIIIWPDSCV